MSEHARNMKNEKNMHLYFLKIFKKHDLNPETPQKPKITQFHLLFLRCLERKHCLKLSSQLELQLKKRFEKTQEHLSRMRERTTEKNLYFLHK